MKTDKNFRLSKRTKTLLALLPFKDQEERNIFKRQMIHAEWSAERAKIANARAKGSKED